jgi:hypothetical protein
MAAVAAERVTWSIVGEEVTTCNCAWGCPCQFNALPTHGRCEALVACRIQSGSYGQVSLDGLTFAAAFWWPGPIHEAHGIARPAIDERATPDQRMALLNIMSAKDGGMPFEIYAAMVETFLEPLFVPIQFEHDRDARRARLQVPGLGEYVCEPIKNPVTGQVHRARIQLPEGFEYNVAEMGNAVRMHATLGDKTLHSENSYAQFAAVTWSNAPR